MYLASIRNESRTEAIQYIVVRRNAEQVVITYQKTKYHPDTYLLRASCPEYLQISCQKSDNTASEKVVITSNCGESGDR